MISRSFRSPREPHQIAASGRARRRALKLACSSIASLAALAVVAGALALAAPNQPTPSSAPSKIVDQAAQKDAPLTWVSLIAAPGADVERFFAGPVYRRSVGGLERIAGRAPASALSALASLPGVIHIPSGDPRPARPEPDPAHSAPAEAGLALSMAPASPQTPVAPAGWYENDTQGVRETWNTLGITGAGVTIAVIDTGVDFGNPALAGRYAVQPATPAGAQAYVGWPIAFDDRSLAAYLQDPARAWPANWGWYVNAGRAITGSGVFPFADPLSPAAVYTAPGTSLSGRYWLGYHPDASLRRRLGRERVPILIADEAAAGVYDAVYLDLNADGAFETRLDREHPVGVWDATGDSVPDLSAGMLYWIADGAHPPPGAEGVYGPGLPVPPAGTLAAFMLDDVDSGGGHGTWCASTAVGNDGGVFVPEPRVASFYTTTYGPLVQGPAPGARIVAMGDVYAGGSADAWYLFTVMGYDGAPASGDEPQIVTLSYGGGAVDNDGWDWESRYLTHLNLTYGSGSPLFIHAAGNGGFGYGTLIQPKAATGLSVGASTQYGTINAWGVSETVSLPARVNSGDVAPFSGRGPGADGTRVVDVVANGMAGTGAAPLNATADGRLAYVHWTGTSRSAPAAGGMAALAAQAFRQARGRWPTYAELRLLLINSARDLGYDPLTQGAGQVDAFRAAQTALGQYGVTVDPPTAVAGDWRGWRYPAFAAGLARGQVYTLALTVTNPSPAAITVTPGAQRLVEIARYTATLETITDTATNYAFGAPDYALDLTGWVSAHPDADLMAVRMTVPFEHFDTLPPTPPTGRNAWRLMVYNWWDDSGDGQWWNDGNGDGRVDWPGELDGGDEWMRFGYSRLEGTQQEVRVGRPYTRSLGAGAAGIWAGAAHTVRSGGDNRTRLAFEVIFYRQADWPEVALSDSVLQAPPKGQVAFQAVVRVPPDAAYGLYQGVIVVADAGRLDLDPAYRPRRINIPLVWQVWPDVQEGAVLGGAGRAGAPYENGRIGGGFGWEIKESGDWRFYGFDLQDPPSGSVILAHSIWEDYPTDLDMLIFGPSPDGFSAAAPLWFGPYSLARVGGTARSGAPGAWDFSTLTGGTEDWASAPAQDGLHALVLQSVLFGGLEADAPFTASVGLLAVSPYPLYVNPASCGVSCTLTMTLRATLDIPGGITGTASGPFTLAGLPTDVAAHQTYSFTVHVNRLLAAGEEGTLTLGPLLLPEALEVPVVAGWKVHLPLIVRGG